jgi:hypothetical protein
MHDISLHSLKNTKRKGRNKSKAVPIYEDEEYPWQTRLDLGSEVIEKVPSLERLEVGDEVWVHAKAKVVRKTETENEGEDERVSIEIQMTSLGVVCCDDFDASFKEASGKKK